MILPLYFKMIHIHEDHYDYRTIPSGGRMFTSTAALQILKRNIEPRKTEEEEDEEDEGSRDLEELGPYELDMERV